jgi:hypothetical protein
MCRTDSTIRVPENKGRGLFVWTNRVVISVHIFAVTIMLLFADLTQNVGNTVVNGLAVAGGAAVGYFGTWLLTWGLCRATIHKTPPKSVQKLLNVVGAIAGGLIVAALLFKGGGSGWGSGSGWNLFGGSGKDGEQPVNSNPTYPGGPTNPTHPTQPIKPDSSPVLRIRMLGGNDVKGDRFYQIVGDATARTLDELKPIVRERMQPPGGQPGIRTVEIIIDPDSVARNHPAVKQLENFARGEDLTVNISVQPEKP